MTSPSIVRPATPADANEIWRLVRLLHHENAIFPISEAKVGWYLDRLLQPERIAKYDTGPRGFFGVIGPVGALEGAIMITFGTVWYSDELTADEHFSFVDPEHRRSNHAKELISFVKAAADDLKVRLIIGVLSNIRTAAKVRLYERQLQPAGAFFIHPAPANVVPMRKAR